MGVWRIGRQVPLGQEWPGVSRGAHGHRSGWREGGEGAGEGRGGSGEHTGQAQTGERSVTCSQCFLGHRVCRRIRWVEGRRQNGTSEGAP